jgi:hypothetical protein
MIPLLVGDKYAVDNNFHSYGMQINDLVDVSTQDTVYEMRVAEVFDTYFTIDQADIDLSITELDITGVVVTDLLNGDIVLVTIADGIHSFEISHIAQINEAIGVVLLVQPTFIVINFSPNQFSDVVFDNSIFTLPHADPVTLSNVYILRKNTLIVTNLLLAPKSNSIKPIMLGFNDKDYIWDPQQYSITSPLTFSLQKPDYILVEMTSPIGSTWTEHRTADDSKSTILAKITLVQHPWLDLKYARKIHFFGGIRLGAVQFRILNPDHSLYQLHGHDWHATFCIEIGE